MSTVSPTPQKKTASPSPAQPHPASAATPATRETTAPAPKANRRGVYFMLLVGLAIVAGMVFYLGIGPRLANSHKLDDEQKLNTERRVIYSTARFAAPKTELPLPGTINAFQQASLYARTDGYVKRWMADIGQVVHEGDLLAELDTPEVDQQLSQAQATAERGKATLAIAQATADRWSSMVQKNAVSKQEADEKNATRDEAKAALDAELADVARLTQLKNFKEIRAPFTGTITYRNIEIGNLVSAGNGTGGAGTGKNTTEMFRVAQTDPLKVYVDVPEANSRAIRQGVKATLHVPAYPDKDFYGEVVRSAGALDNASRTLRTEISVPNPDGLLLPGSYADVRLELSDDVPTTLIPANTLIINSSGTQIALLEDLNDPNKNRYKVHLVPIRVGRDFGTEIEVLRNDQVGKNVKEGDRLVTNPPADLTDGMLVTANPKPVVKPPAPTPDQIIRKS